MNENRWSHSVFRHHFFTNHHVETWLWRRVAEQKEISRWYELSFRCLWRRHRPSPWWLRHFLSTPHPLLVGAWKKKGYMFGLRCQRLGQHDAELVVVWQGNFFLIITSSAFNDCLGFGRAKCWRANYSTNTMGFKPCLNRGKSAATKSTHKWIFVTEFASLQFLHTSCCPFDGKRRRDWQEDNKSCPDENSTVKTPRTC